MFATVRYVAIAIGATAAIACGGWYDTARNDFGSEGSGYTSRREAVGTSGSFDQEITITGCVTRVPHDDYVLTDVNGDAGNERMRQLSAEVGGYRLTGSSEQFVSHVGREVEIKGHVLTDDLSGTPDALRVGSMRSTGRKCSE